MRPLYWLVGLIEQLVIWLGSLTASAPPVVLDAEHPENDVLLNGSEIKRSNAILEAIGRPQE